MKAHDHRPPTIADRLIEGGLARLVGGYAATLRVALRHPWIMVLVMVLTVGLTVELFRTTPKGFVPEDDTGLIMGMTEAAADTSFPAMAVLQQGLADVILKDPSVEGVGSFIGGGGPGGGAVNAGSLFIGLKPEGQRPHRRQGDRPAAAQAGRTRPGSGCSWCRCRTCAPAGAAARVPTSSRCGTPISTNSRPGSPACSSG